MKKQSIKKSKEQTPSLAQPHPAGRQKARVQNGRQFVGKVVSTKMKNTVIVRVERLVMHELYKKAVKRSTKFAVHVGDGQVVSAGDTVTIAETRPISKRKHFIIVEGK